MAVTSAVAAVASAGAGVANARTQSRNASAARGMAARTEAEQTHYREQLRGLIDNPSSVTSLPGYTFGLDQGVQAVSRSNAAKGFLGSGNEAIALTKFGQEYGKNFYFQQSQLLASLAGLNQNPVQGVQTAVAADSSAFDQLGKALASLGYTFGSLGSASGTGSTSSTPTKAAWEGAWGGILPEGSPVGAVAG